MASWPRKGRGAGAVGPTTCGFGFGCEADAAGGDALSFEATVALLGLGVGAAVRSSKCGEAAVGTPLPPSGLLGDCTPSPSDTVGLFGVCSATAAVSGALRVGLFFATFAF